VEALTLIASLDATVASYASQISLFVSAHAQFVLPLVFVIGFLKSMPLIAMFIPSTAFFVAAAAAYAATGGTFTPLWIAAGAGATTGDLLGYAAGYRYRRAIGLMWPLSRTPELLPKGEALFQRWGIGSVLGAKFVWGVRPFIPIIAGIYRMPLGHFTPATSVSSLIWSAIGVGAGFGIWRLWS
jgi:membrane protein DedA with SNARE-associated domain